MLSNGLFECSAAGRREIEWFKMNITMAIPSFPCIVHLIVAGDLPETLDIAVEYSGQKARPKSKTKGQIMKRG